MTLLLATLEREVEALGALSSHLERIYSESELFLAELRGLEAEFEHAADPAARLDLAAQRWYTGSIAGLKAYNGQVCRFAKNVSSNSRFAVNLDDAYPFPLDLTAQPLRDSGSADERALMQSIVLHLLKVGQNAAVAALAQSGGLVLEPRWAAEFAQLHRIVYSMRMEHDLLQVLQWFHARKLLLELAFKVHVLQFALLLTRQPPQAGGFYMDSALEAYTYAKEHFPRFFKDYFNEIAPVITLLLLKPSDVPDGESSEAFRERMVHTFKEHIARSRGHAKEAQFVGQILSSFEQLEHNSVLFDGLAHEFTADFCSSMGLLAELLLFQAVLAGCVNLPNFHKFKRLQRRLSRGSRSSIGADDGHVHDLPFQLPDTNHFLFNFHPIFICPISKEQLVPLSTVARLANDDPRQRKKKHILVLPTERLAAMANPVVVFDHCRHLALRDSVRHLTKSGAELFKCHYCYKKHKLGDVSEGYFIDI